MIKILKFGASWCNPCKALDKQLKGVDLPIISYDVDEEEEMTERYEILSTPVLVFVDENGNEKDRFIGLAPTAIIVDKYHELNGD